MVDDELPCASCGAIVDFEFTADAKMALTGELIRMMASRDSGEERPSLIRLMDCQIGGKVMPIAAGIQQLRQRISTNPKDVGTWLQLGTICCHTSTGLKALWLSTNRPCCWRRMPWMFRFSLLSI
jgi:hypothetical protein